jgi:hypothetical protein
MRADSTNSRKFQINPMFPLEKFRHDASSNGERIMEKKNENYWARHIEGWKASGKSQREYREGTGPVVRLPDGMEIPGFFAPRTDGHEKTHRRFGPPGGRVRA